MKREDVEELRDKVACEAVLEQAGFAVDVKESTRRAVKHSRGPEIIIVNHDGKGAAARVANRNSASYLVPNSMP